MYLQVKSIDDIDNEKGALFKKTTFLDINEIYYF